MITTPDTNAAIQPYDAATDTAGLGYAALRATAIKRIQELIDPATGWTDFNYHDPGVTLLEAILWAASDLAYRSDLAGHWNQRVALDHPTNLPAAGHDRVRTDALRVEALDEFGRRLRLPAGVVGDAATPLNAGDAAVVNRVRRRQLADQLDQYRPALLRVLQNASASLRVCEIIRGLIEHRLGWSPSDDEILAEVADLTGNQLGAGCYENEQHDSLIWPPQRSQVQGHAPVTCEDYLQVLVHHLHALGIAHGDPTLSTQVRRAWAIPGLAAGVGWNGRLRLRAEPDFPAGTTLLLDLSDPQAEAAIRQREASKQAQAFLMDAALAIHCENERNGQRWYDYRSLQAAAQPHRLLGEEIRVAAAGHCAIRLNGNVLLAPQVDADEARPRLLNALRLWLRDGDTKGSKTAPTAFPGGWPPGRPITATAVTQFLRNQSGVEQVSGVTLNNDEHVAVESINPGHYCVPFLAGPQRGLSIGPVEGL